MKLKDLRDFTDNKGIEHINLRNPTKLTVINKYQLGPILGQGAYAVVRVGTHLETGETVAIKIYDRHDKYNPSKVKNIKIEINNLRMLKHPNIVRLFEIFEGERYICLIMSHHGKNSLHDYIKSQRGDRLVEEGKISVLKRRDSYYKTDSRSFELLPQAGSKSQRYKTR